MLWEFVSVNKKNVLTVIFRMWLHLHRSTLSNKIELSRTNLDVINLDNDLYFLRKSTIEDYSHTSL